MYNHAGVDKDIHSNRSSVTQLWEKEFTQPLGEYVVKSKVVHLRPGISIYKYCPRENPFDSITLSFICEHSYYGHKLETTHILDWRAYHQMKVFSHSGMP